MLFNEADKTVGRSVVDFRSRKVDIQGAEQACPLIVLPLSTALWPFELFAMLRKEYHRMQSTPGVMKIVTKLASKFLWVLFRCIAIRYKV